MSLQTKNYDPAEMLGAADSVQRVTAVYSGAGSPSGVVTATQGSLYLRTDGSSTSTRAYINTDGGTTWTNLVTAA